MATNGVLLASVLEYAARGWAVFPILPDLGEKRVRAGGAAAPNPSGWERWATTDRPRIVRTWAKYPWGIGIACGPSNLVVIDSEPDDAGEMPGEALLYELATSHGALPATWTVSTATGGVSRYYQVDQASPIDPNALGPNLRIHGPGHYTIAPPTTTTAGTWYLLQNRPPTPLPVWLADALYRTWD